jgi:hypothetical protein
LKLNKKFTPFVKESDGKLEQIQKLALEFCKAIPFGKGTLGGCVSENIMVYARVGKWFFSTIESITAEQPYVEPATPIDCWRVIDLTGWLKARHYPHSGLKAILLARVKKLIDQHGGPPEPLPPMKGQVLLVKDLVVSLCSMIAHLMVHTTNETIIQDAERHLKMYLSSYAKLEKTIREHSKRIIETIPLSSEDSSFIDDINDYEGEEEEEDDNQEHNSQHDDVLSDVDQVTNTRKRKSKLIPEWIQKHSIICLTNMIPNMRDFGSARHLWEGSAKGEGILKEIKPLVDKSKHKFIIDAHKKFHQRKGLKYVMSTLNTSANEIEDKGGDIEEGNIRNYTIDTIHKSLSQKEVQSLVRLSDNRFMFITNWKVGEGVVFIRRRYFGQCWGADYFEWTLVDGIQDFKTEDNTHYCLFLPYYPTMKFGTDQPFDVTNEHIYYVVTSQYFELIKNGEFVQCRNTNINYT